MCEIGLVWEHLKLECELEMTCREKVESPSLPAKVSPAYCCLGDCFHLFTLRIKKKKYNNVLRGQSSGWLHENARQQKKVFLSASFFEGTGCVRGRSLTLWRRSFTAWRDRTESFATRRSRWSEKSSTSKICWSRSTRLAVSGWNRTAVPKKKNQASPSDQHQDKNQVTSTNCFLSNKN